MDATLVYDGDCRICTLAERLVAALDRQGRIRSLALQDPESALLLAAVDEAARWDSFHFLRDGRATSRGDGLIEVIGALPLGGGIPKLAATMPRMRGASERLYSLLHGMRDALQCGT
ncbi:MAG TPA: DCC1-like thiol-disulfide oxidoreductase family protein [Thermoplasmata archaeon]|nr:DCC1-like thiol-disulfide oxidoreductase family protein [Thermoplasmata archaeon]